MSLKRQFSKEYRDAPIEEEFVWANGRIPKGYKGQPPRRFASFKDAEANKPVRMWKRSPEPRRPLPPEPSAPAPL